jgi:hypothetical protein
MLSMPGQAAAGASVDLTTVSGATPKATRKRKAPPAESGRSPTRSASAGEEGEYADNAAALAAASAANANAHAAAVVANALIAQQVPVFPPPPPASPPATAKVVAGATQGPGNAAQPNPIFNEVSPCMLQAVAAGNPHAKDTDFFVKILEVLVDSGSRIFSFYLFAVSWSRMHFINS